MYFSGMAISARFVGISLPCPMMERSMSTTLFTDRKGDRMTRRMPSPFATYAMGRFMGTRSGTGFRSFHCMKDKRCQRVFCRRENIMTGSAGSPLINERKCRRKCGSNSASGVRFRHGIGTSNSPALQNNQLLELLLTYAIPRRDATDAMHGRLGIAGSPCGRALKIHHWMVEYLPR